MLFTYSLNESVMKAIFFARLKEEMQVFVFVFFALSECMPAWSILFWMFSVQSLFNVWRILWYNELLFSTKYWVNKMHDFSGYIFNILLKKKDKVVVIEYMENCTVTSCYRCNVLVILPAQPIPYKYQKKKIHSLLMKSLWCKPFLTQLQKFSNKVSKYVMLLDVNTNSDTCGSN